MRLCGRVLDGLVSELLVFQSAFESDKLLCVKSRLCLDLPAARPNSQ